MVNFSLEGKVALVTGAAYGIGFAMAQALAEAGAKIAFNCRGKEHMEQALADYKKLGIDAKGYLCDVTREDEVSAMIADIEQTLGTIDILVNNAGIFTNETIETVTEADWERVMDTNLKSMVFASQWFASYNREHGTGGSIVNIASVSSVTYIPHNLLYNISKAGVVTLTKTLARDLGPSNIRVNAVGPGSIPTDLNAALYADKQREIDLCNKIPLGRRGTKDDIANCVLFLAADESSYLTGQVIFAEGGWLLA